MYVCMYVSNQIIDDVIILVHGVVLKGYHIFYNNVVSVKHVLLLIWHFLSGLMGDQKKVKSRFYFML